MGEESTCSAADADSIPRSGRYSGGGSGNPIQHSCLGNPMDRGAWKAMVHGVVKESDTTEAAEHPHLQDHLDTHYIFQPSLLPPVDL